jgi:gliding-associated putative ABC transporter substrate-binding component GldG
MNRSQYNQRLVILTAVFILANLLSVRFFFRWDVTQEKEYTLSRSTLQILKGLESPVTVKAYFSENMPPDIARVKRDFKDLLIEYSRRSKGKVVYSFINPNESTEKETEAMQSGIQPVVINVRDKDQMKQQKAYLGAQIQLGDKKEAIPFMQPGAPMEFALSSTIKKLSVKNKPVIALLQGHGEAGIKDLQQAAAGLQVLNDIEEYEINDTLPIPDRFATVAIINPQDSFPESHLAQLDHFLARGKNIFIAYSRQAADLQSSMANNKTTGLEEWLRKKNIIMEDQLIIDAQCGSVQVRQQQGFFSFITNISFPYFPMVNHFANHPAVKGLEQVILQFASPIVFQGDTSVIKYTPLMFTSERAGTQPVPVFFNVQKQWTMADFPQSRLVMGAAFTGPLAGNASSRMIVIANGTFAVNGSGERAVQLPPDNVNLLVNSIEWLTDNTGLMDLRTKGVTSRPLKQLEDGQRSFYKYANFLFPILAIVLFGMGRMQWRKKQRDKRMQEDYLEP